MIIHRIHYSRDEYRKEYLTSPEWRAKSKGILERDPICKICDKNVSNDVHHLTYERLTMELETDLIGVCRKCHNRVHRHKKLSSISNLKILKSLFFRSKIDKALLQPKKIDKAKLTLKRIIRWNKRKKEKKDFMQRIRPFVLKLNKYSKLYREGSSEEKKWIEWLYKNEAKKQKKLENF